AFIFAHYLFAQYEAFGVWLAHSATYCCDFGRWTLSGPMDYLGLAPRLQGVFVENLDVRGAETNIYTGWRFLVQDFSILGPPLLVFGIAAAYRAALVSRNWRAGLSIQVLMLLAAFLQTSSTLGAHNSVLLAAVFCAIWVMTAGAVDVAQ